MNETYLIFERHAHSGIYFVQASSVTEAIWRYIKYQRDDDAILQADGSIQDGKCCYPHPLAYIEATEKIYGEWQIRRMPAWIWQKQVVEAFCGESEDGPAEYIALCRKDFVKAFPRSRAKAFVWYLKQGILVTFYRKKGWYKIEVLKRYLLNWDARDITIVEWEGGYQQIVDSLGLDDTALLLS